MRIFRIITSLIFTFVNTILNAQQWQTTNSPATSRYEDVFFINANEGWACNGGYRQIYHTQDGGISWNLQYTVPYVPSVQGQYLRSIEFINSTTGFCGSLDSTLYKTTDGGQTWVNIANSISPKPKGICGLCAPSLNTIYGTGLFMGPNAYVIKSTDGGNTWSYIDMSAYSTGLVDVHFIDDNHGFVVGKANPETDGGVILYTADGGLTWSIKHKTMVDQDIVWKIQSPDNINFYCSIEANATAGNVRIAKSTDVGQTWNTVIVSNTFYRMQTVGFLNSQKGWTGGTSFSGTATALFETTDGGSTWNFINSPYPTFSNYNHFFRIDNNTAYLSGKYIYKYDNLNTGFNSGKQEINYEHSSMQVINNPVTDVLKIKTTFPFSSWCRLQIIDLNGKLVKLIFYEKAAKGSKDFFIDVSDLPKGEYIVTFYTNDVYDYKKIIKH